MIKVKICGITNLDDALAAVASGADALGFVFYRVSPRYVEPDTVRDIVRELPPFITTVGVFVDEAVAEVSRITQHAAIDMVQLHGHESPEICRIINKKVIKAIQIKDLTDLDSLEPYQVSAFLLDAFTPEYFGGTGQVFNWDIALAAKQFGRVILAGGLTPDNIQKAVSFVQPYAVDVSSGVEKEKGKKDHIKLKLFIKNAKGA